MAVQVPTFNEIPRSDSNRPISDYHPTLWGDLFLTHSSDYKATENRTEFERLKEEVRKMLTNIKDNECFHTLHLINAVELLGVAYHFKSEIEDALEKMLHEFNDEGEDLHTAALWFRLLRQHGIKASCDIFKKFKDNEGNFKESLITDVKGMLSLYEAAHLSIRGERIMDEALAFTSKNLQSALANLSPDLAEEVRRALNRPIHKCLPRLEARHFITAYSRDESHNRTLLNFATLDFNILQEQHQKELRDITEWWKSLDVPTKLPYARDRVVECYFWIMGVYFEPQYALARKMLSKVIASASIFDDTYDNYGTCEELQLLTEAMERWDINSIDTFPEYLQLVFRVVFDVYDEIDHYMAKDGRSYATDYAKNEFKRVAQSYFAEAKWRSEGHVATFEEYMTVSLVSCCYPMLATNSFLGMGALATREAFEWVTSDPKMVRASSIICRLMDDIVSHELEQTREHVATGIECYMRQHGVSEEEATKMFRKEIADAWKDINEECLKPTVVPMPLLERVLNLTRVIDVIYKDDDGYTNSHVLKDDVASLLKDPVLL